MLALRQRLVWYSWKEKSTTGHLPLGKTYRPHFSNVRSFHFVQRVSLPLYFIFFFSKREILKPWQLSGQGCKNGQAKHVSGSRDEQDHLMRTSKRAAGTKLCWSIIHFRLSCEIDSFVIVKLAQHRRNKVAIVHKSIHCNVLAFVLSGDHARDRLVIYVYHTRQL